MGLSLYQVRKQGGSLSLPDGGTGTVPVSIPNDGTGKVDLAGNRLKHSLYQVRKQAWSLFL